MSFQSVSAQFSAPLIPPQASPQPSSGRCWRHIQSCRAYPEITKKHLLVSFLGFCGLAVTVSIYFAGPPAVRENHTWSNLVVTVGGIASALSTFMPWCFFSDEIERERFAAFYRQRLEEGQRLWEMQKV